MQIKLLSSLFVLALGTLTAAHDLYAREAVADLELDLHPRDVYEAKIIAREVYHEELVARAGGSRKSSPPRKGGGGGGGSGHCEACGVACTGEHYHSGEGAAYKCS